MRRATSLAALALTSFLATEALATPTLRRPGAERSPPGIRAAGGVQPAPEELSFRFESYEGSESLACTHAAVDAIRWDWRVSCGEGNASRRFLVHFVPTFYSSTRAPRLTLETLYYVLPSGPRGAAGTGGSAWYKFEDDTALHEITLGQSVESDTAGLYLRYRPAPGITRGTARPERSARRR